MPCELSRKRTLVTLARGADLLGISPAAPLLLSREGTFSGKLVHGVEPCAAVVAVDVSIALAHPDWHQHADGLAVR